ncbi:MAG: ABC transporter ATP-binding protein [Candidatus Methanodesulfokora sp.]|jgi:branched-chain amino acid transport system ATP-binding protein|nr:MAG: ABC transporter ATP-binding protein [Candidatus Korarchaeota archaeon]
MLKVESLNSGYGKLHVLYDVSVDCDKEEIVAVVGPNGAGKTTLLNSIFGIADIYSGSVKIDGEEITKLPAHVIARKGIAYVLQMINIFSELSVEENLRISASYAKIPDIDKKLREIFEIFPILSERRKQRAGTLSGGERQMLAISIGLIRDPKILLLDEPTAGLMPLYVDLIIKKINEIRKERGISVVLVEQNVKKALEIADRAYVLVSGQIIFRGSPSDLASEKEIMRLYLGMGE